MCKDCSLKAGQEATAPRSQSSPGRESWPRTLRRDSSQTERSTSQAWNDPPQSRTPVDGGGGSARADAGTGRGCRENWKDAGRDSASKSQAADRTCVPQPARSDLNHAATDFQPVRNRYAVGLSRLSSLRFRAYPDRATVSHLRNGSPPVDKLDLDAITTPAKLRLAATSRHSVRESWWINRHNNGFIPGIVLIGQGSGSSSRTFLSAVSSCFGRSNGCAVMSMVFSCICALSSMTTHTTHRWLRRTGRILPALTLSPEGEATHASTTFKTSSRSSLRLVWPYRPPHQPPSEHFQRPSARPV